MTTPPNRYPKPNKDRQDSPDWRTAEGRPRPPPPAHGRPLPIPEVSLLHLFCQTLTHGLCQVNHTGVYMTDRFLGGRAHGVEFAPGTRALTMGTWPPPDRSQGPLWAAEPHGQGQARCWRGPPLLPAPRPSPETPLPTPPPAPASNRFLEGEEKQPPSYKCLIGN